MVNSSLSTTAGAMMVNLECNKSNLTRITAQKPSLDLPQMLKLIPLYSLSLRARKKKLKLGRKSSSAFHAKILSSGATTTLPKPSRLLLNLRCVTQQKRNLLASLASQSKALGNGYNANT